MNFVGAKVVSSNPAPFDSPFTIQVVLDVLDAHPTDAIDVAFKWSPVWDFDVDQALDELEAGPLTLGKNTLTLECDPPHIQEIPDPTGPTALLVGFSYKGREFLHLGYNVQVECKGETPEVFEDATQLQRTIGKYYPKVTTISWGEKEEELEPLHSTTVDSEDEEEVDDVEDDDASGAALDNGEDEAFSVAGAAAAPQEHQTTESVHEAPNCSQKRPREDDLVLLQEARCRSQSS